MSVVAGRLTDVVGASGSDWEITVVVLGMDARARVVSVRKVNCELIDGVMVGDADTVLNELGVAVIEADDMIDGKVMVVVPLVATELFNAPDPETLLLTEVEVPDDWDPEPLVVIPETLVVAPEPLVVIPEPLVVAPDALVVAPDALVVAPDALVVGPEPLGVAPDAPEGEELVPMTVVGAEEPVDKVVGGGETNDVVGEDCGPVDDEITVDDDVAGPEEGEVTTTDVEDELGGGKIGDELGGGKIGLKLGGRDDALGELLVTPMLVGRLAGEDGGDVTGAEESDESVVGGGGRIGVRIDDRIETITPWLELLVPLLGAPLSVDWLAGEEGGGVTMDEADVAVLGGGGGGGVEIVVPLLGAPLSVD